jgi:hypothetical protein
MSDTSYMSSVALHVSCDIGTRKQNVLKSAETGEFPGIQTINSQILTHCNARVKTGNKFAARRVGSTTKDHIVKEVISPSRLDTQH